MRGAASTRTSTVFCARRTVTAPATGPRRPMATSAGSGGTSGSQAGDPLSTTASRRAGATRAASAMRRSASQTQTIVPPMRPRTTSIVVAKSRRGAPKSPMNGKQCGL